MTRPDDELVKARQASRSRITALLLAAFVILMFAITIAKMTINR